MSACRWFHAWSRWSEPVVVDAYLLGKRMGETKVQERVCQRCGAVQERETK